MQKSAAAAARPSPRCPCLITERELWGRAAALSESRGREVRARTLSAPLCSPLLCLVSIKAAPQATEISLRCNQASSPQARAVTPSCGLPRTPLTPALSLSLFLCLYPIPPFVT